MKHIPIGAKVIFLKEESSSKYKVFEGKEEETKCI
jgi:hypothetical protein